MYVAVCCVLNCLFADGVLGLALGVAAVVLDQLDAPHAW